MLSEKRQFPHSFFIVLSQCHEFLAPKLTNFHIFVTLLLLNMTCIAKSPHLTAHLKLNKISCSGNCSQEAQRRIQGHRNILGGDLLIPNPPLEYYNVF